MLTLANHADISGQPLSHFWPLLGQLVHVNFLTPPPWRVLGRLTCVAEAVRYYAPHSFSVQTSKKKLTLAKHVYVSVQPLSHSRPLLGQLSIVREHAGHVAELDGTSPVTSR